MKFISLPNKIQYKELDNPNKMLVTIEPCFSGYGVTIGNALRRVLLSSIPGYAISAVKIKGIDHEFMTIPGVKEDVIEIILNLKKLRLKIDRDEEVRLKLKVKGEREVTGADIEAQSGVEIINKDFVLFTLTDKTIEVDIDLFADSGIGYVPTESKDKSKYEVGAIAIDSIYTPVVNVTFSVENVRVGGVTNYDKVFLTVETDGTISPRQVVKNSSDILIKHLALVNGEDVDFSDLVAEGESVVANDVENLESTETLGKEK